MRHTRYQGAIIKDDQILLIKHTEHETGRSYWVIPGGGREPGETEMACVKREMWESSIFDNHIAYPVLQEIRRALGYV